MDGIRVRELACFTSKGLGVAFADFDVPVWLCPMLVTRASEGGMDASKEQFLTCLVESTCARGDTVWKPDHLRSMVIIHR